VHSLQAIQILVDESTCRTLCIAGNVALVQARRDQKLRFTKARKKNLQVRETQASGIRNKKQDAKRILRHHALAAQDGTIALSA